MQLCFANVSATLFHLVFVCSPVKCCISQIRVGWAAVTNMVLYGSPSRTQANGGPTGMLSRRLWEKKRCFGNYMFLPESDTCCFCLDFMSSCKSHGYISLQRSGEVWSYHVTERRKTRLFINSRITLWNKCNYLFEYAWNTYD